MANTSSWGIFYTSNLQTADNYFKNLPKFYVTPKIDGVSSLCLSNYKSTYNEPFYFALAMPVWIKNALKEFNSKFNNIQLRFIHRRHYDKYIITDCYEKDYKFVLRTETPDDLWKKVEGHSLSFPLIEIITSKDYDPLAQHTIKYMIPIVFRMFGIFEHYFTTSFDPDPKKDYLKLAVEKNNKKHGTWATNVHAIAEFDITENDLLLFDDIQLMNEVFKPNMDGDLKYLRYYYNSIHSISRRPMQTDIMLHFYQYRIDNGEELKCEHIHGHGHDNNDYAPDREKECLK